MNASTIIVLIILAVVVGLAVKSVIKNKGACKCSGCNGDCNSCPGCK